MTLKTLTDLHLGNKNCQSFNFYEGVAPVLDTIGSNLLKLILEDFTEVDVDYIGQKCPNLKFLALSGILTYAPIGHLNSSYFTKVCDFPVSRSVCMIFHHNLWPCVPQRVCRN